MITVDWFSDIFNIFRSTATLVPDHRDNSFAQGNQNLYLILRQKDSSKLN